MKGLVKDWLTIIDDHLQACLFLLLGLGLVLSTLLMWHGLIESGDWALVTTGLFGSNAIGGGLNKLAGNKAKDGTKE